MKFNLIIKPLSIALLIVCISQSALAMESGQELNAMLLKTAKEYNLNPEIITDALTKGGNINSPDEDGRTLLHWASSGRNFEVVKALIKNGVDINSIDKEGSTPLLEATRQWRNNPVKIEIMKALIENGADINHGANGWTPLHWACADFWKEDDEAVQILLSAGADINCKDKHGRSPVDYAKTNTWGYAPDDCNRGITHRIYKAFTNEIEKRESANSAHALELFNERHSLFKQRILPALANLDANYSKTLKIAQYRDCTTWKKINKLFYQK